MKNRLFRITRGFVITIAILLAFGWGFSQYAETLSDERQNDVLIKAIPFVAVFVSVILGFVCLIVVVAVALEGKVPQRSYRPIEGIIIAGILLGVVGLFQGWKLFAYEVGFLLLLGSLMAFMVWSHLTPMPTRQSRRLPPLSQQAHIIGLILGVVVWAVIAFVTISDAKPHEPYGFGQTLWDFKDDTEKAQIKDDAESDYRTAKIPLLILVGLVPASLVYLGAREVAATQDKHVPGIGVSLS
ncbi:MAG: hypothetical protein JXQ72_07420 [Anaerolineae bacterium]|nr:hypothetical protein [Anaerolineae bacterium]